MFRPEVLLVAGLVCLAPLTGVQAGTLPQTLGYSFYVEGEPAGRADIKITQTAKELVFESRTRVLTNYSVMAYTARTVADPKTYLVRQFSMEGTKGERSIACAATVTPDSVVGYLETKDGPADRRLKMPASPTLLFEDWLVEHEVLMALTQAHTTEKTSKYGLLFPSTFTPATVTMGYAGDVLVEAGAHSMTARKLVVILTGAAPYESHVDPKTGVPVYIRFPQSETEIFLDKIFGENPLTYYQPKAKKE
jgi:hypothetical protein